MRFMNLKVDIERTYLVAKLDKGGKDGCLMDILPLNIVEAFYEYLGDKIKTRKKKSKK